MRASFCKCFLISSRLRVVFWKPWKIIWHIWKERKFQPNHRFQGNRNPCSFVLHFEIFRAQTEQDLKSFSRDFVVNDSDDPQKILEEEAKALAQFNKVCLQSIELHFDLDYRFDLE